MLLITSPRYLLGIILSPRPAPCPAFFLFVRNVKEPSWPPLFLCAHFQFPSTATSLRSSGALPPFLSSLSGLSAGSFPPGHPHCSLTSVLLHPICKAPSLLPLNGIQNADLTITSQYKILPGLPSPAECSPNPQHDREGPVCSESCFVLLSYSLPCPPQLIIA